MLKKLVTLFLTALLLLNICTLPALAGVDGQGDWGDQEDGTFVNPILNADYSDPDIIRVGEKYYMITSTFQLAPGMAILESTDLINWKTINYCIPDMSQFGDRFNWDQMNGVWDGVFAGALRYLEWKEKQPDGTYVDRHKWFMYTTIFKGGFIVATADDVYGQWTAQYMKDKDGQDLTVPEWDDPCPYWEFNEDGTLKSAYLIASKCGGAWYPHVFQMSLDGMQLLDGDRDYMGQRGDFTRVRNDQGELIDVNNNIIPSAKEYGQNHSHAMNDDGTLPTVLNAQQITGREGTVVRDIYTAEAVKIVTFGEDTAIGQTTFTGRHGENQKVSDYIYIYNNEDWDGIRFAVINRAKSIYGDRFDENGKYLGPGTPEDPGSYETQRMILSTNNPDTRNPNQGGFVDVPASMSTDGEEHWYWMTQFGRSEYTNLEGQYVKAPDCRATSLQPVTWVEGFPMAGDVSGALSQGTATPQAQIYDGTSLNGNTVTDRHHPDAKYVPGVFVWEMDMPPIQGTHELVNYQDSDEFNYTQYNEANKLNPMWQWWYQPREGFWDLTGSALRLYAFRTQDGSDNPMRAGNTVCQRYISADYVQADVKLDLSNMKDGQTAGLIHTTGSKSSSSIKITMANGQKYIEGTPLETDEILLRSSVNYDKINTYSYSVDGGVTYHPVGDAYKLILEDYRGDYIGIYTYNNQETSTTEPQNGYIDVDYFHYTYSRQGASAVDLAFPADLTAESQGMVALQQEITEGTFWFAPAGTVEFVEGSTMTKAESGACTIQAPSQAGTYHLYAVNGDVISEPSQATLTVLRGTVVRVEAENYQWGVSNQAHFWINDLESASNGKILDNTLVGDIYYLGEMDLSQIDRISVCAAHDGGGVSYTFYTDMEANTASMTPADHVDGWSHDAPNRYKGTEHVTGGTELLSISCSDTGGWSNYALMSATLPETVTGLHKLYLKVEGAGEYGGNLDYVAFHRMEEPEAACSADAAISVQPQRDEDGNAIFEVKLKDAKNVAAVQVMFEAPAGAVVTAANGFTYLDPTTAVQANDAQQYTAVLCYLQNETFTSAGETTIATIRVPGTNPTVKLAEVLIGSYVGDDQTPAFGEPVNVDPDTATFSGFDLTGDGIVNLLDIVAAQEYYQINNQDPQWEQAAAADFDGNGVVDLGDLLEILLHYTL